MTPSPPAADTTLRVQRTYSAAPRQVYEAWTRPEVLKKWFAPSPQFTIPSMDVDARVGGRYRIVMQSPEGQQHIVVGEYIEMTPHSKLVFTWTWENDPDQATDTLVTIEITAKGDGAELTLTHERFRNAEVRGHHLQGWGALLDRLQGAFN